MWYVAILEWDLPRGYQDISEVYDYDMQDGDKVAKAFVGRTLEQAEYRAGEFSVKVDNFGPRMQYVGVTDKLLWRS